MLLALLLQVGPNPNAPLVGSEADILNRPPRANAAATAENPVSAWLGECLAQLEQDAARAHAQAQIRRNATRGAERVIANHCLGLAATELALWDDAITAFRAARDETPDDEPSARARFGLMAGNAALASGDANRATVVLGIAQEDARRAASATLEALAQIDMARALVALERPEEALAALDSAIRLEPATGEAWLLKATLLRRLDRLAEAQGAIERAVELSPLDSQIGLEAGVIAVLSGREEAARQSWQSVIDTQPDSMAAATAQDYLAQLGPPTTRGPDAGQDTP
jgi:tetratricopeptide (TPR) repeat protein